MGVVGEFFYIRGLRICIFYNLGGGFLIVNYYFSC